MAAAPTGIVGRFAANRPILANALAAAGLVALAVSGARKADVGETIILFAANALYVVALPMALAALTPRRIFQRILFIAAVAIIGGGLIALDRGVLQGANWVPTPPSVMTVAALCFTAFLFVLSPLTGNVARLTASAPAASLLGVIGALGYFAVEPLLGRDEAAAGAGLALGLGVAVGVGVGVDFSRYFAKGASRKTAAAAAGHASLAPIAYSLLAIAALFGVQTFKTNFGAIEWRILWAAFTADCCCVRRGAFSP